MLGGSSDVDPPTFTTATSCTDRARVSSHPRLILPPHLLLNLVAADQGPNLALSNEMAGLWTTFATNEAVISTSPLRGLVGKNIRRA